MFGLSKEEVEAIVDRKICKVGSNVVMTTKQPCPPKPVYIYYAIMNNKTLEIGTYGVEKGNEICHNYYGDYYWKICDTPFCKPEDAKVWIEEHAKAIKKEGYHFDASMQAWLLKRKLCQGEKQ